MRRAVAVAGVVGVASLLVLAGCGADRPGGPPTVTPAPVPSAGSTRLAPGVTDRGVVDSTALVGTHVDVLRNHSFRTTHLTVRRGPTGDLRTRVVTKARFTADRRRYYVRRVVGGPTARRTGTAGSVAQYAEGALVLRRQVDAGTVTYSGLSRAARQGVSPRSALLSDPTASRTLFLLLSGLNTTVTGNHRDVTTGATTYRLAATGIDDRDSLVTLAGRPVENVSFVASVAASGLVRSYRFAYTTRRGDGSVRTVLSATFEGVGTTAVERPPWYGAALDAVAGRPTAGGSAQSGRRLVDGNALGVDPFLGGPLAGPVRHRRRADIGLRG